MKTIKINRLSATNFQGASTIDLTPNGRNIIISGRNASGKTTHFNLYTWLICNKMSDGKMPTVSNYNAEQITTGEIQFDNGLTFRRESDGKYFINGVPTSQIDYFKQMDLMMNHGANYLAMPFNFSRLHWKDKRNLLIQMAGNISLSDVLRAQPDISEIANLLEKYSPDDIKKRAADKRKRFKADADKIPTQIKLYEAQIAEIKTKLIDVDTKNLHNENQDLIAKHKSICADIDDLEKSSLEIQSGLTDTNIKLKINNAELAGLRKQLHDLNSASNNQICPLCGAPITTAVSKNISDKASDLTKKIVDLEDKNTILQRASTAAQLKLADFKVEIIKLKADKASISDKVPLIFDKIFAAKVYNERIKFQVELINKIDALRKQHRTLTDSIATCDRQIYLADLFAKTQADLLEAAINRLFDFVTFKLFDTFKSQEGFKECCEPMINGVPFESLSHGEKFKAASDILMALQEYYQVKPPLWIDDAESYTPESLIVGDQQIIALHVADTDLEVVYGN